MLCLRYFLIERLLTPNRSRRFGDSDSFMLLAPGIRANAYEIEECPEHGHSWDGGDNAEETHDLPPAMMARKIRIEGTRRVCPCNRGIRTLPPSSRWTRRNARAPSGAVVGDSKTQRRQVTREREGEGVPEVSDIGPVAARHY